MNTPLSSVCVGSQLRKRRQEMQLTLEDVASQLHIKKDLINDIENGNYAMLRLPYLKGYVRSYARLLSFSESDALLALDRVYQNDSINGWKVFSSNRQVSSGDMLIQSITFIIISVLLLLVTWQSDSMWNKNLSVNDPLLDQGTYQMADNTVRETKK